MISRIAFQFGIKVTLGFGTWATTTNQVTTFLLLFIPGLYHWMDLLSYVTIKPHLQQNHNKLQWPVDYRSECWTCRTKQKRRKIHLYNKADWTTFRSKLTDYQTKFLSEHHGKAVRQLWSDFTDKLDQLTDQCIPTKVIKGKPSLPWISREIKRLIHKRNKYYKSYRKTGNSQLREKYVSLRHTIRKKTKESQEAYLEGLLGVDGQKDKATGQGNIKKLFQYLKNSRTDQQGIPPLKQNGNLHTETKEKANILNQQFQSVFTPLAPLSLQPKQKYFLTDR